MDKWHYTHTYSVSSSMISVIYYNSDDEELVIKFTNGSLAGYARIGRNLLDQFLTASSVGGFYHSTIRLYPGFKVPGFIIPKTLDTDPRPLDSYRLTAIVTVVVEGKTLEEAINIFKAGNPNSTLLEASRE